MSATRSRPAEGSETNFHVVQSVLKSSKQRSKMICQTDFVGFLINWVLYFPVESALQINLYLPKYYERFRFEEYTTI